MKERTEDLIRCPGGSYLIQREICEARKAGGFPRCARCPENTDQLELFDTFGRKTFQIVVNDCTGGIAGQRPISWTKVFFYIILPALVLLALLLATHR